MGDPTTDRPRTDWNSLDTPCAAALLTPYHNDGSLPSDRKAPLKDPANPLDIPSTAAAAAAISPLKSGSTPRPGSNLSTGTGVVEGLPSYTDALNASAALAIVKSHSDNKRPGVEMAKPHSEATSFLDNLREQVKEGVYGQFLDIMIQYGQGKCRPQEVSRKVTLLFHKNKHSDLVDEMYKWTPWQHRFYLPFASCTR